ncbi:MAG: AAA family ATPase [Phycisphaerales bacterium]|nr:AAA family ATPase [Phycisphaerales bacterium]
MKTVAIVNQKGGCGKTTSAVNLAGVLARDGYRTLLVDLDPQSHCAAGLAIPEQRIDLDIGDAMIAGPEQPLEPSRLLWRASRNLDLAPSRMKLAGLEAARGGLADLPDKDRRLAAVLLKLARDYDVCLIDCSPSIGLLTYNALAAADHVLIPVETGFFSLQGASKQVTTIRTLNKRLGVSTPYWLVATIHDEESALSRDLLDEMRRRFGQRVVPVVIRRDSTLKEAASFGQPVVEYAPQSAGAVDYRELAEWLVRTVGLSSATRPAGATPALPEETEEEPPLIEVAAFHPSNRPVAAPEASDTIELPVAAEPQPEASGQVATLTRAQDLAQRARLLLLRRADEQLKRVVARKVGPAMEPAVVEAEPKIRFEPPGVASVVRESRLTNVRPLFGARSTRSGVLLVQPLGAGRALSVAGDFNGWSPDSHAMLRNETLGVHEICIPLAPGMHRYRLVIDGRWSADPYNDATEPNPFGEPNSLIEVAGA